MLATRPGLILKRRIKAPPAKVYAVWTDPEKMMQWWGSDNGPTLCAEADVRVGGRFRVRFQTLDGLEHECSGVYRAVMPERKLAFTWAWTGEHERESLVTVHLKPDGDGTLLTLTHEKFVDDGTHDHHRGWTGALDKLERFCT